MFRTLKTVNLRHLLEYEDHEIRDFLGDLEGVGLSGRISYSIWVRIPWFVVSTGYSTALSLPIALGRPFWSSGNLETDQPLILDSLRRGDFTLPIKPGLDWKALTAPPDSTLVSPSRIRSINGINFLSKPSLQNFFENHRGGDLHSALLSLRDEFISISHLMGKSANGNGFVLVYGSPDDPGLLENPDLGLRRVIEGSGAVLVDRSGKTPKLHWD